MVFRYPTINCLDDIPVVLAGYEGEKLPGEIYDADEQCLQYSDHFSGACTDTALPIYGVQVSILHNYIRTLKDLL